MIRAFTPVLKRMAWRLWTSGALKTVQPEDLVQAALFEVHRARRRFDAGRGASFRTFALRRAHFAMLDELRRLDHVPRLERARARQEGRRLPQVVSTDADPELAGLLELEDRRSPTQAPAQIAAARDGWQRILRLVDRRQAEVLDGYFRRERTLKEIGRECGLSESRICQLLAKALRKLRTGMEARA